MVGVRGYWRRKLGSVLLCEYEGEVRVEEQASIYEHFGHNIPVVMIR